MTGEGHGKTFPAVLEECVLKFDGIWGSGHAARRESGGK